MFGLTFKTIQTSKEYTIEEFYEAIKDLEFPAGEPLYYKNGIVQLVIFPELDRYNQVRIGPGQLKKAPYNKFTISKGDRVGIQTKIENKFLSKSSYGASSLFSYVGRNVMRAEKQVKAIYEVLQTADL